MMLSHHNFEKLKLGEVKRIYYNIFYYIITAIYDVFYSMKVSILEFIILKKEKIIEKIKIYIRFPLLNIEFILYTAVNLLIEIHRQPADNFAIVQR